MTEEDRLDAFCGLYCGACEVLRAERDGGRERAAAMFGGSPADIGCGGCRTGRLFSGCRGCEIRGCAMSRGFEFCGQCAEFPCDTYRGFAGLGEKLPPHFRIVIRNQREIAEKGADEWRRLQRIRWSCPSCGAPFAWYSETCGGCGRVLSELADWRSLEESDLGIFGKSAAGQAGNAPYQGGGS